MNYKKYVIVFISTLCLLIISCIGMTWYVDPYFHYHEPNKHFDYVLADQRYINDGISRNFDYDAIITGTSMTENFKTSEFDRLFNVNSIKVAFSGGSYKEVNNNLKRAIQANGNIKYIIRSLDYSYFFTAKDEMKSMFDYPTYLTDDDLWNDVSYILNKDIFFKKIIPIFKTYSKQGSITSFDDYTNWSGLFVFEKDSVLRTYTRTDKIQKSVQVSEDDKIRFQENIDKNIISIIQENPNIKFYYFLTPYSILFWDDLIRKGEMEKHLVEEQMIIKSLLDYDNVHLFSFSDNFDLTTNLNNYKDIAHYSGDINSYMLKEMHSEKHRLTRYNYKSYLSKIKKFYSNYDYESLFK